MCECYNQNSTLTRSVITRLQCSNCALCRDCLFPVTPIDARSSYGGSCTLQLDSEA